MPISIKNDETERIARQLAELTGESLTEAIRMAVSERYERVRKRRKGWNLTAELNEIGRRCGGRPVVSAMSEAEILGYDEMGIPTR